MERFLEKVSEEPSSGCWLWKGQIDDSGYGSFRLEGKTRGAHRASWILFRGPIPPGLFVCHKCDIRYCVNPDHLFLGTIQENQADMKRKGRSPFGNQSPRSRLTEADVLQIKALLAEGKLRKREIARQFSISTSAIWHISRGRNWRRVQPASGKAIAGRTSDQPFNSPQEINAMASFSPAFDFVMNDEDPHRKGKVTEDAGGQTRFGIAQKFHPELPEDFFTGTAEG
jgi:hypothetical protein